MSGIILTSRNEWALYEKELISKEELGVETREGRSYRKWSCQRAVTGLVRVVKLIEAIAWTLFTLCLALVSAGVRELWGQALSGRETIVLLSPLPKEVPYPTVPLEAKHTPAPSLRKEDPVELPPSAPVFDSETSSEYGLDEESSQSSSESQPDEFPPLKEDVMADVATHLSSTSSDDLSKSDSSDEIDSSSGSSSGSESDGIDFDEDDFDAVGEKNDIDFGLGEYGIGNLLAALDSLTEEVDFRAHPLYPRLLDKRKEVYALLQDTPKESAEALLSDFIENCLVVHGNHPAWESLKAAYEKSRVQKRMSWEVPELFYRASALLKDYKLAVDIEKVRNKILSFIPPDTCGISNYPKKPGRVLVEDHLVGDYAVSVRSAQGIRDTMEDEDLATLFTLERPEGVVNVPCFAVFDGHGGSDCSKFLRDNFAGYMARELSSQAELNDLTITNAIKMAFAKANTAFLRQDEKNMSGSTAVVALVINNALWVANSGDARAVLDDAGTARQLSNDAKPTKPEFLKGIRSRGGWVLGTRVNGILATARAFGDRVVIGVTARPQIRKFDLTVAQENRRRLILACDGLFDVVGSDEAVEHIKGLHSPSVAARDLFDLAFERGTTDNVTVMVVQL
ncbi:PP2C family serine/threonine-protein phosphatase [Estrella lausannensis]|uniref:Serine/threonine PP2C protein phosphatase n=1 Tax=Estrella lausannensis TaxID=483423 RepID=A0A0H5DU20_9BACT|nr:PP2C family protein-serine/threonine phosphatase [Estrella lausannensis]CRX39399.1 serine/threonine PP2C protein phosphatase [Estrella lausannensis]